jgi:hypothetical protein
MEPPELGEAFAGTLSGSNGNANEWNVAVAATRMNKIVAAMIVEERLTEGACTLGNVSPTVLQPAWRLHPVDESNRPMIDIPVSKSESKRVEPVTAGPGSTMTPTAVAEPVSRMTDRFGQDPLRCIITRKIMRSLKKHRALPW